MEVFQNGLLFKTYTTNEGIRQNLKIIPLIDEGQ